MKRRISLIIATFLISISILPCLILLGLPKSEASASSNYLRVITSQTAFFANANSSQPLFYLPYTYYVKLLGEVDGFYHVECYGTGNSPALDGYVKKQDLFDDGLPVTNPFVNLTITTATTSVLYSDSSLTTPLQYVFAERNMRYYGSYLFQEKNVFYVEYNGKLGYVKESDVYPFAIKDHPNELTFLPSEPTFSPEQPDQEQSIPQQEDVLSLKIIIIMCLIFAGLVALFIALKHKPNPQSTNGYYDENDYD